MLNRSAEESHKALGVDLNTAKQFLYELWVLTGKYKINTTLFIGDASGVIVHKIHVRNVT